MATLETETLIIGAGVIGSAVAMHLALQPKTEVCVVDFDLEGSFSSSELNAGGVRATWVQPLNILCSKITIEYLASIAQEVGFRPCGYLWLHGPEKLEAALKARDTQLSMGWQVESWNLDELRKRVPLIDKTEDLKGAVFSPNDGLVNSNLLKNHFRTQARKSGARFEDRIWIQSAKRVGDHWECSAVRFAGVLEQDTKRSILEGKMPPQAEIISIRAKNLVNCAGPWASQLASVLGYESPAYAVRRQVSIFDCRGVDLNQYGMIVDSSGVYFHPEATSGLAGFARPDEQAGFNFEYDGESFFMESIWPALYERSSQFERLKHLTGWAGLYEVSPDESGIVGRTRLPGVFEAHSFSGHGLMHSFAVGMALSQLICRGKYPTHLDLSVLSGDRFEQGKLMTEGLVI